MKLQYSFSATKNAIFSIVFSMDQCLLVCKMTVCLMENTVTVKVFSWTEENQPDCNPLLYL